jgi:hypothetical protein
MTRSSCWVIRRSMGDLDSAARAIMDSRMNIGRMSIFWSLNFAKGRFRAGRVW